MKILCVAILTLYTGTVFIWHNILNIEDVVYDRSLSGEVLIVSFVAAIAFVYIYYRGSHPILMDKNRREVSKKGLLKINVILFTVCFLMRTVYILAYYPGAFGGDVDAQLTQYISHEMTDWHPAIQTIIVLGIPYRLTHSLAGIVIIQNVVFTIGMTYATYVLLKNKCIPFIVVLLMGFVIINPHLGMVLLWPWKDCSLLIAALFTYSMMYETVFSGGDWLCRYRNMAAFITSAVLTTLFRHNAVLLTFPMLLLLIFIVKKKAKKYAVFCFTATFVVIGVIRGPIYDVIGIAHTTREQKIAEMYGVPMTILGNVLVNDPGALNEETRAFLYEIATQEEWEEGYQKGSWNSVKWKYGRGNDVIETHDLKELVGFALDAILSDPSDSLDAFIELTDLVWAMDGKVDWFVLPQLSENKFGFEPRPVLFFQKIIRYFWEVSRYSFLKYLFWFLGILNMIYVWECFNGIKVIKKLCIVLPILCYNFGTMMLLCGADVRFFVLNIPIFPIIWCMLRDCDKEGAMDAMGRDRSVKEEMDQVYEGGHHWSRTCRTYCGI